MRPAAASSPSPSTRSSISSWYDGAWSLGTSTAGFSVRSMGPLRPVALLVLLARAAPARVVAPDRLVLVDATLLHGLDRLLLVDLGVALGRDAAGRGGRQRTGLRGADTAGVGDPAARRARAGGRALGQVVVTAAVAVRGVDLDLDVEDHPREVRPDGVHQVGEEVEGLVLVGDERVDLGEPAEVDALAQVVHVVQVLAPLVVDDLQQQIALERTHELVAELLLATVVERERLLGQHLDELLALVDAVDAVRPEADREDALQRGEEAVDVPVLDEVAGGVLVGDAAQHLGDLLAGDVAHVAALEHLVAVLVDDPPLLVHHVVVLEDALADQEVLLLDLLLCLLDLLRQHPGLDGLLVPLLVGGAEPVEDLVDPVTGEQAHEVVLGAEEEAGLAGIALTAGAAAQLVVDPARLVALGAADEEAAGLEHAVTVFVHLALERREDVGEALVEVRIAGLEAQLAQLDLGQVLGIAAELDVDAAARHVRRDRHRAGPARLGHDVRLAGGVLGLGVEDRVVDALAAQLVGQQLGDLDGDRAHEDRLVVRVTLLDLAHDRVPLAVPGLVDLVVAVVADHRAVRRDLDHRQLVDLHELRGLGEGRAGHARQLGVHAEVVLEGDRRKRLVLLLDRDALLGLDRLVQALGPAAAVEDAARELVDDLDLAVDDGVVDVALVERLGLQRLDQVVDERAVLGAVQVVEAEEPLGLLDALLRHRDGLVLLVELEVEVGDEVLARPRVHALGPLPGLHRPRQLGEPHVVVRGLLGRAGDDQRGAGLVDEDVVDLVDHAEEVHRQGAPVLAQATAVLDLLLDRLRHVVAQVVEAELRVRAVRDVARVGLDLGLVLLVVLEHAD